MSSSGLISAVQGCSFAERQAMRELTGSNQRMVCLRFRHLDDYQLFVHPAFLAAWSGVLRSLLEDVHGTDTPEPGDYGEPSRAGEDIVIPLDDADADAWKDALALMHPSHQLFRVTWVNAARLLLLAHKYDMPGVIAHVEAFLMEDVVVPQAAHGSQGAAANITGASSSSSNPAISQTSQAVASAHTAAGTTGPSTRSSGASSTVSNGGSNTFSTTCSRLAAHLSPDAALDWLQLTSLTGLDQAADICINYLVQQQVPLTIRLLSAIQPQHADQLLAGLRHQLQAVSEKADQQEQLLSAAVLPIKSPTRRARCPECKTTWHKLPDGRSTPHCLSCGRKRPIILGELYHP